MKQAGIYVNDNYCGLLTEDEEGFKLISHSFLSEKMQIAYCSLLDKRREALEIL